MRSSFRFALVLACLAVGAPAHAAEFPFTYKTSFRNVTKDPENIWSAQDLAPTRQGAVTIHEYQLKTPQGDWLISQIWNADCSSDACPTKLVRIAGDGSRKILVDDMMHQIIPPDDPHFVSAAPSKSEAVFARQPFLLSGDGRTLINGDFRFPVGGAQP